MAERRIDIHGEIGGAWGITLADILPQLEGVGANDTLSVHIHSPGGEVYEGWAIHNALLNTGAKITTVADGQVGSIATIIFLSGSTRIMQQGTQFFIHNPWTVVGGDADAMEKAANDLRKAEKVILDYYTKRTGADEDRIRDYMTQETGLTASEAQELGFATEIREPVYALASLGKRPQSNQSTEMDKKTLVASFKEAMQDVFGKKEPKALTLTLAGGDQIDIQTSENFAAVGDSVKLTDGSKSLADGAHQLSDNRTFNIEAGKITSIEEAPEVSPAEMAALFAESLKGIQEEWDADMAQLRAAVQATMLAKDALTKENEALKAEIEGIKRETSVSNYNAPKSHGTDAKSAGDAPKADPLAAAILAKRKEFSKPQ